MPMKNPAPSGILIVDKPEQMSSAAVVNRIKKLPGIKKAGHTGTLDPLATGILLCPVNKATRISRFLLKGWKTYEAVLMLGVETDTQDAAGSRTRSEAVPALERARIEAAAAAFKGEISQLPPVYSALKHKGRPLYEYARAGRPVQKDARQVTIDRIAVTWVDLPEIGLTVRCSSGTYVRTLCADIGRSLGCGGHMKALRRTEVSGFGIAAASPLPELENKAACGRLAEKMVPMAEALWDMPAHTADKALTQRIKYGKIIFRQEIDAQGIDGAAQTDYIKILDPNGKLLAILYQGAAAPFDRFNYACVFHPD